MEGRYAFAAWLVPMIFAAFDAAYIVLQLHVAGRSLVFCGLVYLLSYYLNAIIHELGHLLGGLASGYRLSRLQLAWLYLGGNGEARIHLKSGCAFACVMDNTNLSDPKYIAYNIGGLVLNLLVSLVGIAWAAMSSGLNHVIALQLVVTGISKAVVNAIPFRTCVHMSDGYVLCVLKKSEVERYYYAAYLRMVSDVLRGNRGIYEELQEFATIPYDLSDSIFGRLIQQEIKRQSTEPLCK